LGVPPSKHTWLTWPEASIQRKTPVEPSSYKAPRADPLLLHPAASDEEAKKARDAAWLPCSSSTPNEDSRERQKGSLGAGGGNEGASIV